MSVRVHQVVADAAKGLSAVCSQCKQGSMGFVKEKRLHKSLGATGVSSSSLLARESSFDYCHGPECIHVVAVVYVYNNYITTSAGPACFTIVLHNAFFSSC